MNIYDEAIEELKKYHWTNDYTYKIIHPIMVKALERAKKVEELLGLYQRMWKLPYGDIEIVALWKQIKQKEEELK